MSIDVAAILMDPNRGWQAAEPASESALEAFRLACRYRVPDDLFTFWRFSNGGESDRLALPPMRFALDRVEDATAALAAEFEASEFPGLVFFGGNGGMERIALDYRAHGTPSVVMVDPITGLESAEKIADTVEELIMAIGIPYGEVA